jgi:hypothetical protein
MNEYDTKQFNDRVGRIISAHPSLATTIVSGRSRNERPLILKRAYDAWRTDVLDPKIRINQTDFDTEVFARLLTDPYKMLIEFPYLKVILPGFLGITKEELYAGADFVNGVMVPKPRAAHVRTIITVTKERRQAVDRRKAVDPKSKTARLETLATKEPNLWADLCRRYQAEVCLPSSVRMTIDDWAAQELVNTTGVKLKRARELLGELTTRASDLTLSRLGAIAGLPLPRPVRGEPEPKTQEPMRATLA